MLRLDGQDNTLDKHSFTAISKKAYTLVEQKIRLYREKYTLQ